MQVCKAIGCMNPVTDPSQEFCEECLTKYIAEHGQQGSSLSDQYPQYYKSVEHLMEVDVYAVHHLFGINDPSGAIQHASKKLLLSGVRTGGKSVYDDIREARDTLTRWLELQASLS